MFIHRVMCVDYRVAEDESLWEDVTFLAQVKKTLLCSYHLCNSGLMVQSSRFFLQMAHEEVGVLRGHFLSPYIEII